MQEHRLLAFPTGVGLHEPGTTAFDLDLAPGLLLDMLDVCATLSDDLGAKVESGKRFEVHRDTLLGPFTL